jgi:sec-independent protein translocase protein TatA
MTPLVAIFPGLGPGELIVLLLLGVLLFGKKLPDVGRYLGKGIVEFKKGVKGIEDDLDVSNAGQAPRQELPAPAEPQRPPQKIATAAPKFEDVPLKNTGAPPQV